jgi:hypothetical protein
MPATTESMILGPGDDNRKSWNISGLKFGKGNLLLI